MRPHTPTRSRRTARGALLALLLGPLAAPPCGATGPRVVVTIAPVHSLVAAVMDGIGTPLLLLPAGVSPHAQALRPSQSHELEHADLVIWIGPALERFLARPLSIAGSRRSVALMDAAGMRVLSARAGGVFAPAESPDTGVAGSARGDDHDHADPHLWLDPDNARAIAELSARELSALDAANATRYAENAARTVARIDALDRELAWRLAPLRGAPYVVFHDAYRGFEAHFGLAPVAAVSVTPERAPGARRVAEIRAHIVRTGARCVFSEPQFEPRLVRTLVEGTGARTGVLDPLGSAIPPGPGAWFTLMRGIADALVECLSGG